ncbi:glycoside hydrolase family 19 protein [Plantactinospora sp. BB1]|uniref:glycoside hydrolase family 19 protein n=1 Tax=Plantactinospora sp. BB1 TaxID=2071627 RepID=UPI000D16AF0D|nr:glycoside hydrolase family 19 protein [Plantactinospora sp. BB1]AVT35788.1 chitinase [Plantactinospora sp. BB1]
MSRLRALVAFAALVVAAGLVAVVPSTPASAAACAAPWQSSAVYWGGDQVSHGGRNYQANWWTQNERPPGTTGVWRDLGTCGGGTTPPPPGGSFAVSEAQFNQMFPGRNSFYTYSGLVAALSAYPAFTRTGNTTVQRQEAAAFLANVHHETGGLVHIVEQNTANYPHYCDAGQPYGCPAGQAAYYGRGPIQLSWNFNYNAAGNALGLPLLTNPWLVQNDAAVAWKTAIWYWMTQNGPGRMTAHNAMVTGAGFGETIRSINGSIECNGGNPAQVQSRINRYQQFVGILGVPAGANLSC